MADNLRSSDPAKERSILGSKATGELDADADHVPNVVSGLKAAISNANTSEKAKKEAEGKLAELGQEGLA